MRLPVHKDSLQNTHLHENTIMKNLRTSLLSVLALGATSLPAIADARNPSSLFLFPLYEQGPLGGAPTALPNLNTLITVTNTSSTQTAYVHYVFVSVSDSMTSPCTHLNDQTRTLTPLDTYSLLTNPFASTTARKGYAYAFAVDRQLPPWRPVSFNHLIADAVILDGVVGTNFSFNPVGFRSISEATGAPIGTAPASWSPAPLLDGVMYSRAPDRILIPKFMAQNSTHGHVSELVFLNLAMATTPATTPTANQMLTLVDFLVFNDNEEAFSAQYEFRCWKRTPLSSINGLFDEFFLANFTNDAPGEVTLSAAAGDRAETGWILLKGGVSTFSSGDIQDPAIMAVLIENTGTDEYTAELPFFLGERNGKLQP